MKKAYFILLALVLAMVCACGGGDSAPEGEAGKAEAGADFSKEIGDLDAKLKKAATKEEFQAVKDECLKLMMSAALKGADLAKDAKYKAACQLGHAMAMADAAIKASKPDAESPLCMGASMALAMVDESESAEVKAKVAELDKACGYAKDGE